jgi:type I site-specific restriction endonuclease
MPELTPKQLARQQIDAQLVACGWVVQDYKQLNPFAGRGIALREVPLKSGTRDYLLLVDRKAVGVTQANKQGELVTQQSVKVPREGDRGCRIRDAESKNQSLQHLVGILFDQT